MQTKSKSKTGGIERRSKSKREFRHVPSTFHHQGTPVNITVVPKTHMVRFESARDKWAYENGIY